MARVVGAAASDRAEINTAQLINAAIEELDAPHFRTLARFRQVERDLWDDGDSNADNAVARSQALTAISQEERVPVVAALIRSGVVYPATLTGRGVAAYSLTDFGRDLLSQLEVIEVELIDHPDRPRG